MRAVAAVLPFRVNAHVLDALIDWDAVPDCPIFQLTFPQPGMLGDAIAPVVDALRRGAGRAELDALVASIRATLNPHPAGQQELNVPRDEAGRALPGLQHKYRETLLFFPAAGQTCHAYCTYCFRWAQFVGDAALRFAAPDADGLVRTLRRHPEITSVLFTGGDPLVMRTRALRRFVEPLLAPEFAHVNLRFGTKALTYWPARFVTDDDADDLLRLLEEVRAAGRSLSLMAHVSHPRELEPAITREAIRRVQDAGAVVRSQAPVLRHVNDDAEVWRAMLRAQVRLGIVPYYLFMERDTGARGWFELPIAEALDLHRRALRGVTGLARSLRGPTMSCAPGKVVVLGTAPLASGRAFVLSFHQARDPQWVGRPFFARFDPEATWFDQLVPADEFSRAFFAPSTAAGSCSTASG